LTSVVDLLERLAALLLARDVGDEEDDRAGRLLRGMDADRGVGRSGRAAADHDRRLLADRAVGVRREDGRGFEPGRDRADLVLVAAQRFQHRHVGAAGHEEHGIDTARQHGLYNDFTAVHRGLLLGNKGIGAGASLRLDAQTCVYGKV